MLMGSVLVLSEPLEDWSCSHLMSQRWLCRLCCHLCSCPSNLGLHCCPSAMPWVSYWNSCRRLRIDKMVEWGQFPYRAVLGAVLEAEVKPLTHQKNTDGPSCWDTDIVSYQHHLAFLSLGWWMGFRKRCLTLAFAMGLREGVISSC